VRDAELRPNRALEELSRLFTAIQYALLGISQLQVLSLLLERSLLYELSHHATWQSQLLASL
jgi:hypothetical protein